MKYDDRGNSNKIHSSTYPTLIRYKETETTIKPYKLIIKFTPEKKPFSVALHPPPPHGCDPTSGRHPFQKPGESPYFVNAQTIFRYNINTQKKLQKT